jgi:hypothetical protein
VTSGGDVPAAVAAPAVGSDGGRFLQHQKVNGWMSLGRVDTRSGRWQCSPRKGIGGSVTSSLVRAAGVRATKRGCGGDRWIKNGGHSGVKRSRPGQTASMRQGVGTRGVRLPTSGWRWQQRLGRGGHGRHTSGGATEELWPRLMGGPQHSSGWHGQAVQTIQNDSIRFKFISN